MAERYHAAGASANDVALQQIIERSFSLLRCNRKLNDRSISRLEAPDDHLGLDGGHGLEAEAGEEPAQLGAREAERAQLPEAAGVVGVVEAHGPDVGAAAARLRHLPLDAGEAAVLAEDAGVVGEGEGAEVAALVEADVLVPGVAGEDHEVAVGHHPGGI